MQSHLGALKWLFNECQIMVNNLSNRWT